MAKKPAVAPKNPIIQPHQLYGFPDRIVLSKKDVEELKKRKFRLYREKLQLTDKEAVEWWQFTVTSLREMGMIK